MEHYKNLDLESITYFDDDGNEQVEKWYDIENYEGYYQISNLTRIKSLAKLINYHKHHIRRTKDYILKQSSNRKTGHLYLNLYKDGQRKTFGVHVLVALTFIPNPFDLLIVEHLNDISTDNRPENLMWSTSSSNLKNAYDRGLKLPPKGESNGRSKLNKKQVLEIRESDNRTCQLAKIYGVNPVTIENIRKRKIWKHI
jgi:hypothetical protein